MHGSGLTPARHLNLFLVGLNDLETLLMCTTVLPRRSRSAVRPKCRLIQLLVLVSVLILTACRQSMPDEVVFAAGQSRPDATVTPGIETVPQDQRLFVELKYSLGWDHAECDVPDGWGEQPPWVYRVREDGVWFALDQVIPENTIGFAATDFSYKDLGGQEVTPITQVPFAISAVNVLRVNEDGSIIVEVSGDLFVVRVDKTFKFEEHKNSTERPGCRAYWSYELRNHGWLDADMFHFE
jgi:hypothetical protein